MSCTSPVNLYGFEKLDNHLAVIEIGVHFAEMNPEGGVEESKESVGTCRTHTEVMRSLGYEPPLPVPKKPKTN